MIVVEAIKREVEGYSARILELEECSAKILEGLFNRRFSSSGSQVEDNMKSDDISGQAVHSSSRMENKGNMIVHSPSQGEKMGDTISSNHVTEIQFNPLKDPPQPTSVFDDGYCIYQTPTPSNFTPNSKPFSATGISQDSRNLLSENPYPFAYLVLVPGIVNYFPCWFPSWSGWIASWIGWLSPPWICQWPSFL
jgi:hypothetical protein